MVVLVDAVGAGRLIVLVKPILENKNKNKSY